LEHTFTHSLTYEFEDKATIPEIAASLLANERFIKDAFVILETCHPGLEISKLEVRLAEVAQRSPLKEIITAAVVFGFQEDLEEEVPEFIEMLTGITISEKYDSMITVIVVAITLWGVLNLIEKLFKKKSAPNTEEAYQKVTNVAGDLIQVTGDNVRGAIEERVGGKRKRTTVRSARDIFLPAKKHGATSIEAGRDLTISAAVIDEVPSELDEEMFKPTMEEFDIPRTTVSLRAHDLDRSKAGWAGVVSAVSEKRVKIQIDPSVSADTLFTREEVVAAVRVYQMENDEGDMAPYLYVIQEIHDDLLDEADKG
jgi:hypothetical protein